MSRRVDEQRLAAIEARVKAAAAGPWETVRNNFIDLNAVDWGGQASRIVSGPEGDVVYVPPFPWSPDDGNATAAFVAESRQDVVDLAADLREERERVDQLERLLGYVRRPAEIALAKVPPVRDAAMPGHNVTVTWHTGDFVLRELLDALKSARPGAPASNTDTETPEAALKLAIRAFTVDVGGPTPRTLVPNGPAEAAWCRLADYLLALPGETGQRVAALVCDYLEPNIERLQALRVAAEAFFKENFQDAPKPTEAS